MPRYTKRPITIKSTYHINNHPLSVLNEIVYRGVLFDDKFLFKEHLNFILPKVYALFGFVKHIRSQIFGILCLCPFYASFT